MTEIRVNPTRMELKKLQNRYATARRGYKLLKDKCDGLMKQFLALVREDKELREGVEAALKRYYGGFAVASTLSNPKFTEEALMLSKRLVEVEVSYNNVMSVTVPKFDVRDEVDKITAVSFNYGLAFTSAELDTSIRTLNGIFVELLRMAELEKKVQLIAEEIEKTRRRVNALEYIIIPQYLETIRVIKMKLEENERGNTIRLMKVKDMMLSEQRRGGTQNIDADFE